MSLLDLLRLPEVKNTCDLDDSATTHLHRGIIQKKPFLRRLYKDFYETFRASAPRATEDTVLVELGSGGGFIKSVIPRVVTSDLQALPWVDLQFSALNMPFEDRSVDTFFMMNVLHHVSDPVRLFNEFDRCLKPGGRIVMIEPANSTLGRFVYQNFHHEDFDPSGSWKLEKEAPLSCANGAIPWIIFERDRADFDARFPQFDVRPLRYHTPLLYLASGGFSLRQLLPSFAYPFVKGLEWILTPFSRHLGLFFTIHIEKNS